MAFCHPMSLSHAEAVEQMGFLQPTPHGLSPSLLWRMKSDPAKVIRISETIDPPCPSTSTQAPRGLYSESSANFRSIGHIHPLLLPLLPSLSRAGSSVLLKRCSPQVSCPVGHLSILPGRVLSALDEPDFVPFPHLHTGC